MMSLLRSYSTVLRFVLLFFGAYFLLSALYLLYLKNFSSQEFYPDYITNLVARQSNFLLNSMNYHASLRIPEFGPGMLLTLNKEFSVRIIEGCNAISIMILFFSFVIAFAEGFKKTFLFLLNGIMLIYIVNVARIVLLAIILYKYPEYEKLLHGVVFPGIIYGLVFILWLIWVKILKPSPDAKN